MTIYFEKKNATFARDRFSSNAMPACANDQVSAYGDK
jgi:hypothetical protein